MERHTQETHFSRSIVNYEIGGLANGEQIILTQEEVTEIRAEWAATDAAKKTEDQARTARIVEINNLKIKAKSKTLVSADIQRLLEFPSELLPNG